MVLSDFSIRQVKPAEKDFTLCDSDGLYLNVRSYGGKSWLFRFHYAGKRMKMSLGGYPEVSLRDARALRDEARALLLKGINPKLDRKRKRQSLHLAAENSFLVVFNQWFEHRKLELKEGRQSTISQMTRIFGKDVLPYLDDTPIRDVKRSDLLRILARIEQRRAFTTAGKVRTWLKQMFRYAMVMLEDLESNPALELGVVAAPKPPVANNPYLKLHELPSMLQSLRQYQTSGLQTQLGIRMLLLTGVRTGELRQATPDQFDLERGLWIIPPQAVKQLQNDMRKTNKRPQDIPPYVVPLPVQAQEIVQHLLQQFKPAQKYLLAKRGDLKERISENTLNGALRRMGYADQLTGHGIRSTISTALNEIGYPSPWIESQLSHSDKDKVRAAYNHAEYVEQRRSMMQDWADRLDLLEQNQIEAASTHLTIHIDGIAGFSAAQDALVVNGDQTAGPIIIANSQASTPAQVQRLPGVPEVSQEEEAPVISDLQRERLDMLKTYEAPSSLPVPLFAKLAGKSKDQINRELKAGKLLSISMGNRGQRIPEWQLDPLRQQLVQRVLKEAQDVDAWQVYRVLSQPHDSLDGIAPVDMVTMKNMQHTASTVIRELHA
ncbi:tyrosine-type recombinase/integrase [Pseudomonas aeruginosa]|uniref:tyrosine-type recombinase/integrase n=1 Tax=Pseudomonas aeruginosa TaxID=287 RepID=UPI000F7EB05D|nr:integrase arm-type DNA-binding domain-containing protein [Pseudomonas aeruginosa]RTB44157.1 DUF4102 domain-containing protein [Pseudomonas aeruginosa]